jgi:hypothetical protein
MEPSALGERLARLLDDPPEPETTCGRVLAAVAWPWPESAGDAFLRILQEVVRPLAVGTAPPSAWKHVLMPGARGIPARCIEPALVMLSGLPSLEAPLDQWQQVLDLATEKLRIRQQFNQELGR